MDPLDGLSGSRSASEMSELTDIGMKVDSEKQRPLCSLAAGCLLHTSIISSTASDDMRWLLSYHCKGCLSLSWNCDCTQLALSQPGKLASC